METLQKTKVITDALLVVSEAPDLVDTLTAVRVITLEMLNSDLSPAESTVYIYVANALLKTAWGIATGSEHGLPLESQPSLFGEVPF